MQTDPRKRNPIRPSPRIHIFGASGSGTTTLGRALSSRLGLAHFDVDDYYWLPTDPPFREKRPVEARLELLRRDLGLQPGWLLSGSLVSWGDSLIHEFDLAVFLYVPPEIRMSRLKQRELQRFGAAALSPGGAMHEAHLEFMEWAAAYDSAGPDMRSLRRHESWLSALPCPVLRMEGQAPVEENVEKIIGALGRDT